jgi:hypothetical protein
MHLHLTIVHLPMTMPFPYVAMMNFSTLHNNCSLIVFRKMLTHAKYICRACAFYLFKWIRSVSWIHNHLLSFNTSLRSNEYIGMPFLICESENNLCHESMIISPRKFTTGVSRSAKCTILSRSCTADDKNALNNCVTIKWMPFT